jgi:hypothetical protein
MKRKSRTLFFRKRLFLNPTSTRQTSHILVEAESSRNGEYQWGHYMLTLADCRRRVQLEFFLGTKRARQLSLKKINLQIDVLTRFRDAVIQEIELIDKAAGSKKRNKGAKATKQS